MSTTSPAADAVTPAVLIMIDLALPGASLFGIRAFDAATPSSAVRRYSKARQRAQGRYLVAAQLDRKQIDRAKLNPEQRREARTHKAIDNVIAGCDTEAQVLEAVAAQIEYIATVIGVKHIAVTLNMHLEDSLREQVLALCDSRMVLASPVLLAAVRLCAARAAAGAGERAAGDGAQS